MRQTKKQKAMSEAGRALQAKRKQVEGTCAYIKCGKPITGIATKKYCDNTCRQANKNLKNKLAGKPVAVTNDVARPVRRRRRSK